MKNWLNIVCLLSLLMVVSGCEAYRTHVSDLRSQRTVTAYQRLGTAGDLNADPDYRKVADVFRGK